MKPRLSPATVIAAIALIAALGGTAYAAGAFTKQQKKQVEKIATKVFDSRVGGASVKRAAGAKRAETAAKAAEALRALVASRVDVASKAGEATKVAETPKATEAARASEATRAATATDVERLGGRIPSEFQDRVRGACQAPQSITAVRADGSVACASPVQAVRIELGPNGTGSKELGNGLRLEAECGDPSRAGGAFVARNVGQETAERNFLFGGAGEALALGGPVPPEATRVIALQGRAAVDMTWVTPTAVTTLNLHLFRSTDGTFCEVTGTAMTAFG